MASIVFDDELEFFSVFSVRVLPAGSAEKPGPPKLGTVVESTSNMYLLLKLFPMYALLVIQ